MSWRRRQNNLPLPDHGHSNKVLLYVDLHGHSKKNNMFMYGVENPTDETLYMTERVMPTLLDRASPLFSLGSCTFDVSLRSVMR